MCKHYKKSFMSSYWIMNGFMNHELRHKAWEKKDREKESNDTKSCDKHIWIFNIYKVWDSKLSTLVLWKATDWNSSSLLIFAQC